MRDLFVIVFLMRAKSNTTSKYFIQSIIFRIIHFLMPCSCLQLEKEKNNERMKRVPLNNKKSLMYISYTYEHTSKSFTPKR